METPEDARGMRTPARTLVPILSDLDPGMASSGSVMPNPF